MSDSLRPYGLKRSLPVSSVHGILQASIPEWVATPSSRGSSPPRDGTCVSCIAGRFFTTESPGKPPNIIPTCQLLISVPTHWVGSWNGWDGSETLLSQTSLVQPSSFLHAVQVCLWIAHDDALRVSPFPPPLCPCCPRTHLSISAFPPPALFLWNGLVAPWSPCRVHVTIRAALMEHLVRDKQDSLGVQLPDVGSPAGFLHPSNTVCPELQGREKQRP